MAVLQGIRAVIFDFDGTLVNTEALYAQSFLNAVKKMGLDKTNDFECDADIINFYCSKMCGIRRENQRKLLSAIFPDTNIAEFQNTVYDSDFDELVRTVGIPAKSGVNEIFEYLRQKGIKIAIASMSKRQKIIEFCAMAGIDLVNVVHIIGGTEVENAKPHPEIYLKCMAALDAAPNETVVVEDAPVGALAGINSGCKTIIVPDLAPIPPEIKDAAYKVLEKDCLIQLKELL
jgi:HAD superfamily hydrolase (TIGR01509 family)